MTDYSDLVQRLRNYPVFTGDCHDAADAIEAQAKQIEKIDDTRIEYIGMINKLVDERENLKTENEILKTIYNQGIDAAAELLNSVDLPREELAAAVRKLKK